MAFHQGDLIGAGDKIKPFFIIQFTDAKTKLQYIRSTFSVDDAHNVFNNTLTRDNLGKAWLMQCAGDRVKLIRKFPLGEKVNQNGQ